MTTLAQSGTVIDPRRQLFIDFVASGQINSAGFRVTFEEFAASIGVDRRTLYKWEEGIPNFWAITARRSMDMVQRRAPRIMNAMYAKALRGDVAAAKLLLAQGGLLSTEHGVEISVSVDTAVFD